MFNWNLDGLEGIDAAERDWNFPRGSDIALFLFLLFIWTKLHLQTYFKLKNSDLIFLSFFFSFWILIGQKVIDLTSLNSSSDISAATQKRKKKKNSLNVHVMWWRFR